MTLASEIEKAVAAVVYPDTARNLYIPVKYTLESPGKRIRPMLCLKACEVYCGDPLKALSQAVGIEMFHNFTLIHDDVMDKSDTRRGRPTVFAEWGADQAILSGDALLTMATQKMAECDYVSLIISEFNAMALAVYEGQQLDVEFEGRDDVTTDEYLEMIRLKTSALLGSACKIGALVGGASDDHAGAMYEYGEKMGLAFQLRDDWLDTFGDIEEFGKPIGSDIRNRKKTWLFITAMQEAPFEMNRALGSPEHRLVEEVCRVYDRLNLSERCDQLARRFCNEAVSALSDASVTDREQYEWFRDLAYKMIDRKK